jgi:hypothetical protein
MLYCPRCRSPLQRTDDYCRECGHEVGGARCANCHVALTEQTRFCPACGQRNRDQRGGPRRQRDERRRHQGADRRRRDERSRRRRAERNRRRRDGDARSRTPANDRRQPRSRRETDGRERSGGPSGPEGRRAGPRHSPRGPGDPAVPRARRRGRRTYDRSHPGSPYARDRARTPAPSKEEITRRRAMRFGGGLISTGFTLSAIDGVLRLLMDDPPTAADGTPDKESSPGTASLDPRLRGGDGRAES